MTGKEIREVMSRRPKEQRVVSALNILIDAALQFERRGFKMTTDGFLEGVEALWEEGELTDQFGPVPTRREVEEALRTLQPPSGSRPA